MKLLGEELRVDVAVDQGWDIADDFGQSWDEEFDVLVDHGVYWERISDVYFNKIID